MSDSLGQHDGLTSELQGAGGVCVNHRRTNRPRIAPQGGTRNEELNGSALGGKPAGFGLQVTQVADGSAVQAQDMVAGNQSFVERRCLRDNRRAVLTPLHRLEGGVRGAGAARLPMSKGHKRGFLRAVDLQVRQEQRGGVWAPRILKMGDSCSVGVHATF